LESQGWQDDRKSKARGKFQKQGQQIGNQVTNRTQKSQQGMATTESNVPDKQAQTTDWSHQGTTTAKGQAPTEAFILSNGHHVSKLQVIYIYIDIDTLSTVSRILAFVGVVDNCFIMLLSSNEKFR
jgi:hypothetical protein